MGSLDADLPREAFVFILDKFGGRTGAAATCLKALKAAYRWGEERSTYPNDSPVFGVKSKHKSGGGAISWTAEDVEKCLKTHGPGTMARLWFCLAYATHSRIGDAPTMGLAIKPIMTECNSSSGNPPRRAVRSSRFPWKKSSPKN